MIPAPFTYHRPRTLKAALKLLQAHGPEVKPLAGGQSLLTMMKLRLVAPGHVVDLGRIAALRRIRKSDGTLRLGALVTHRMIESSSVVRRSAPALAEAAALIGDLQVRNLGTIGGSLAHADPAADYPAVVLALDGEVVLVGSDGERVVPATQFFRGVMTTAAHEGELLTEVRIPAATAGTGGAYLKMTNPASGFALAGVAAALRLDEAGRCTHVRIGITGVAAAAYRARLAEEALVGLEPTDEAIARAADSAAEGIDPNADVHATPGYRARLARVLTRRALAAARDRARPAGTRKKRD